MLNVAIDDALYQRAPIFADAAPVHAVTAFSAAMMSGAVMIGLMVRARGLWMHAPGIVSLALLAADLVKVSILFVHGE